MGRPKKVAIACAILSYGTAGYVKHAGKLLYQHGQHLKNATCFSHINFVFFLDVVTAAGDEARGKSGDPSPAFLLLGRVLVTHGVCSCGCVGARTDSPPAVLKGSEMLYDEQKRERGVHIDMVTGLSMALGNNRSSTAIFFAVVRQWLWVCNSSHTSKPRGKVPFPAASEMVRQNLPPFGIHMRTKASS